MFYYKLSSHDLKIEFFILLLPLANNEIPINKSYSRSMPQYNLMHGDINFYFFYFFLFIFMLRLRHIVVISTTDMPRKWSKIACLLKCDIIKQDKQNRWFFISWNISDVWARVENVFFTLAKYSIFINTICILQKLMRFSFCFLY